MEGGVLMLGGIGDVVDDSNPKNNPGAWEILKFNKLPTFSGDQLVRRAYL